MSLHYLMHLMSHRILETHKKNMENMRDHLHAHHVNHEEEKKKHERSLLLQEQLHQAMKVHSFRRDLLAGLARASEAQQVQQRQGAKDLAVKLSRIETEEKRLASELAKKTRLHAALTTRISQLEREVDDVLTSVKTNSK